MDVKKRMFNVESVKVWCIKSVPSARIGQPLADNVLQFICLAVKSSAHSVIQSAVFTATLSYTLIGTVQILCYSVFHSKIDVMKCGIQ